MQYNETVPLDRAALDQRWRATLAQQQLQRVNGGSYGSKNSYSKFGTVGSGKASAARVAAVANAPVRRGGYGSYVRDDKERAGVIPTTSINAPSPASMVNQLSGLTAKQRHAVEE